MLLERGTDPTLVNAQGVTILHLLCKREPDVQLVNLFLRICAERNHSVQINAQDKFGNTPLHEALKYGQIKWVDYLLRRGADSNLTNADGLSPLHVICQRNEDDDLIEFFVKKCNDVKQTVHFNARDKEGRTPLEYAVSRLLPRVVDVLLAKHANLSGFVFPTAAHFTEILNLGLLHDYHFKLRIAAGALSIVEKLESRGYDLDRSNALAIMDLFAKSKVLEKPTNLDESWYDHQSFVSKAQEVMICQDFSLYDLIRLRAKDAAHKLTPTGYYDEFVCMRKLNHILRIHKESSSSDSSSELHRASSVLLPDTYRWPLTLFLNTSFLPFLTETDPAVLLKIHEAAETKAFSEAILQNLRRSESVGAGQRGGQFGAVMDNSGRVAQTNCHIDAVLHALEAI
ncbi:unnamed protein product [Trichogramma brassicae]|uniref:Uncharacterized protein n=1 Tax=Trichogramma brassicae TaxID=86971 RepID=A0A6H5IQ17_9HYME|nr:unnamed protein product [Trichogramma brassicae]